MQTASTETARPGGAAYALYLGLILLLVVIIVLGYLGFRQFSTAVMPQMSAYNLLALAVIAGLASFFSPCAFPLLPGYLSFYSVAGRDGEQATQPVRTLSLGLAAAAGVVTFNLILGTIIGLLGGGTAKALSISGPEPSLLVSWFRGGLGFILIGLGLTQWLGLNLKPAIADTLAWRTRPTRASTTGTGRGEPQRPAAMLFFYGLGYNAAGMGCTGPILAGLTIIALSAGGFSTAVAAFVVFSATMGGLMLIVSWLVATSQDTLIGRLKANTPRIKQVSSALLVLVGLFNIFTVLNANLFVKLFFP